MLQGQREVHLPRAKNPIFGSHPIHFQELTAEIFRSFSLIVSSFLSSPLLLFCVGSGVSTLLLDYFLIYPTLAQFFFPFLLKWICYFIMFLC